MINHILSHKVFIDNIKMDFFWIEPSLIYDLCWVFVVCPDREWSLQALMCPLSGGATVILRTISRERRQVSPLSVSSILQLHLHFRSVWTKSLSCGQHGANTWESRVISFISAVDLLCSEHFQQAGPLLVEHGGYSGKVSTLVGITCYWRQFF